MEHKTFAGLSFHVYCIWKGDELIIYPDFPKSDIQTHAGLFVRKFDHIPPAFICCFPDDNCWISSYDDHMCPAYEV